DLQAALGQLGHKTAQGECTLAAALKQPLPMRTGDLLRAVAANSGGRNAAGLAEALHPFDRRAGRDTKPCGSLVPRQPFTHDGGNNTFAKIVGKRSCHPMLLTQPAWSI